VNFLERFRGKGRVVLAASDATQYSFEGNQITGEGTRSVFTRFLVEGLTTGRRIVIARNIHRSLPSHIRDAVESPFARDRLTALESLTNLHRIGNDRVRAEVINQIAAWCVTKVRLSRRPRCNFLPPLNPEQARREAEGQVAISSARPLPADGTTAESDQLHREAGAGQSSLARTATEKQPYLDGSAGRRGAHTTQGGQLTAADFALRFLRLAQAR